MKNIFSLCFLSILILSSCNSNHKNIETDTNICELYAYYDEPCLATYIETQENSNIEIYRLTYRFYGFPTIIGRITNEFGNKSLIVKIIPPYSFPLYDAPNRNINYEVIVKQFDDRMLTKWENLLEDSSFWGNLKAGNHGLGDIWNLEGYANGKYRSFYEVGPIKRTHFYDLCMFFMYESGIDIPKPITSYLEKTKNIN